MPNITNGVCGARAAAGAWCKSRRSHPSGNCVEVAVLPEGSGISVCNFRNPDGPAWIHTRDEIAAFILGARDGDFDDLTR